MADHDQVGADAPGSACDLPRRYALGHLDLHVNVSLSTALEQRFEVSRALGAQSIVHDVGFDLHRTGHGDDMQARIAAPRRAMSSAVSKACSADLVPS